MNTRSCKAKGRRLQQFVRDALRTVFSGKLENGDIESRQMGGAGTDIILSPSAQKLIPFDFEVKNQEKLNIWSAIQQARYNTSEGRIPLLIFSRNNSEKYAVIEFSTLLELLYGIHSDK